MKIKTPIKRHSNLPVRITQLYGNTSNNSWYASKNINFPFHNGIDFTIGNNPALTYGSECVACFDGRPVKRTWDNPMSTKGNGLTIQSEPFKENGKNYLYQAVYWHLSEIVNKDYFKKGEVLGYVGNNGTVFPEPSPVCAFCGSHLHFMIFKFEEREGTYYLMNYDNGVGGAIDPLPLIDDVQGSEGTDTGIIKDLPVIEYFFPSLFEKIKEAVKKLIS